MSHIKINKISVISGARFLTGMCFSVTFLIVELWQYCVSVYIQCDGALPSPYVPVRVTLGALVAH